MDTKRRAHRGFTLVEVLVAMFVTTLIMGSLGSSFILLSKNFFAVGNYVDLSAQSRNSLGYFGRDMRMTANVYEAETMDVDGNNIIELDIDIMTPSGTQGVSYEYNTVTDEFTRTTNGVTQVLLKDCTALTLTYFDINNNVTTNLGSIKKVQLDAITRRFVKSVENTDQLITSTYMMRNRNVTN